MYHNFYSLILSLEYAFNLQLKKKNESGTLSSTESADIAL